MAESSMLTFGPVPSRRLGQSLGINNVRAKVCSYSCVYCQLGRTTELSDDRHVFYEPADIARAVESRLIKARQLNEQVDYLTFVSNGEPTLDVNLGRVIQELKKFGFPVAVISNSSLIWREDVQEELNQVDWVSLKVDAVERATWEVINRPHRRLRLPLILDGLMSFAAHYHGVLVTETMLVSRRNDNRECVSEVAEFLCEVKPHKAYVSIPTRPPAEKWATSPDAHALNEAYQVFSARLPQVELLIAYEGDRFASTGQIESDLLAIAAVHPLRDEALAVLLNQAGAGYDLVERLLRRGSLVKTDYAGHRYYLRSFIRNRRRAV